MLLFYIFKKFEILSKAEKERLQIFFDEILFNFRAVIDNFFSRCIALNFSVFTNLLQKLFAQNFPLNVLPLILIISRCYCNAELTLSRARLNYHYRLHQLQPSK